MRFYLTIANLLLITGAAYFGVGLFYQTTTSRFITGNSGMTAVGQAQSEDKETHKSLGEYRHIKERNLFHIKAIKPSEIVEEKVDVADLKKTELKLKLWGTVTGGTAETYAVIEDTKLRKQTLYRVNDTVQTAVVKEIHREKVILEVEGTYEVLEMEKIKSASTAASRRTRSTSRTERNPVQSNVTLKREKIESAVNDLNTLMKQIRIRPHFKDGKPDGLTISGIRSKSIFSDMGLRNGDVITGVDGNMIESVDDALKLYESLQSATSVQVQLRRRGQLRTIDYRIEE
jgi:general secretion pathway protein C